MPAVQSSFLTLGSVVLVCAVSSAQAPSAQLDYVSQIYGPPGYAGFGSDVRASDMLMLVKSKASSGFENLHALVDAGAGWTYDRTLGTVNITTFDVDGNVAAHGDFTGAGAARVIVEWRIGGQWTTRIYSSPDAASGGTTMWAEGVAVDGTTLVVSDYRYGGGLFEQGAVYFYEIVGTQIVLKQRVLGGAAGAWLGRRVDVAGDLALATYVTTSNPRYGVRTYRRTNGVWSVEQSSAALDFTEVWQIRMSDDGLAALRRTGNLDVLAHGPNGWFVERVITEPTSGNFPIGSDVSEGVVAIGRPYDDGLATNAGALNLWARNGGWQWMDTEHASDRRVDDYLGMGVSLVGKRLYAGAPGDDDAFANGGAVYVYDVVHLPAQVICPAPANSDGCVARIAFAGTPSMSGPDGFDLSASDVRTSARGFLLYGTSGLLPPTFGGGVKCVAATRYRTAYANSGGTPGVDCDGVFALDFNPLIQSGSNPELAAGATVVANFVFRDPLVAGGMSASDAAQFTILP